MGKKYWNYYNSGGSYVWQPDTPNKKVDKNDGQWHTAGSKKKSYSGKTWWKEEQPQKPKKAEKQETQKVFKPYRVCCSPTCDKWTTCEVIGARKMTKCPWY